MFFVVIFKVYDTDCNGKVSFDDMLTVLRDLTGQYMSEHQRKVTPIFLLLCNFVFSFCYVYELAFHSHFSCYLLYRECPISI